MYIVAAISIERLLVIKKPILARCIPFHWRIYVFLACACMAFVWSTIPLNSVASYPLEPSHTSCSIEWMSRLLSTTSYFMSIFVFIFLIPLAVVLVFNVKLAMAIREFRKCTYEYLLTFQSPNTKAHKHNVSIIIETRRTTLVMIVYVGKYTIKMKINVTHHDSLWETTNCSLLITVHY